MAQSVEKLVSASRVTLHRLMLPEHANALGNVHGGEIMKMVDETGAICAMRHAQRACVTIAMDSMSFKQPVHVGDVLSCEASVNYVGRTSMEVGVKVHAENPITGQLTHTNSAYLVYVAIDGAGKPCQVPALLLETDTDRRRWEAGQKRQERRLASKG